MDESDVDICQASNNTDVFNEEKEELTDDSESGSETCVDQEKDGANDFLESSTRPISAVSAASNVFNDGCFQSNSRQGVTEDDDINHQNNGDCSRQKFCLRKLLKEKNSSDLDFNAFFQNSASPSDNKLNATEPDESLDDNQSIDNIYRDDPSVSRSVSGGPRSSSPAFGKDQSSGFLDLQDLSAEIRELDKSKNNSASISDNELSNLSFPNIPQNDPADFVDRSSIDGGGSIISHGSSHSFNRSYIYSTVSVGEDIPHFLQDDGDCLIPKFEANGKGFCWPMDKLPLSGDRKFEEGAQWEISKQIGYGASGQCFQGYPVAKEDKPFCVKKCQYNEEEVKALCLAAKEIYAKKISKGAKKIVSFYGATYYKPNVCIFMEYMEGGTVNDAIIETKKHKAEYGLEKNDCVHYFKDVLLALDFIHRKGIVHNDIKADNVLLTASKVEAKLCDFGKASAISQHYPASRDVWSGGCFLLEMLGKKYSGASRSGFLKKGDVLNRLPDDVDQDTKQVLSMCFCADRSQCTASYVLTSDFFKEN